MAELQIDSRVVNGIPTVYLQGEMDSYSAPRVRHVLDSMTDSISPKILIDMTRLEYIDSAGLGVLVSALKQAADSDGTLALIAPPPMIARVLKVTGLDKLFTVFTDEAEALRQWNATAA